MSQYNYNSSNELTSTPSGNYTYDNNGNLKSDPRGASYSWDFENRLTQVILPGTGGHRHVELRPVSGGVHRLADVHLQAVILSRTIRMGRVER